MSQDRSWWFAFRGSELLVLQEDAGARVPSGGEWAGFGLAGDEPQPVGELAGIACHAVGLADGTEPPGGAVFQGLRRLWGALDEDTWKLAGRAAQIV
ncbi:MAG TPA: NUDIX-like domain-containing protein, partial [Thermoanaerobaculia bacterium]